VTKSIVITGKALVGLLLGPALLGTAVIAAAKPQPKSKRESVYTNLLGKNCIQTIDQELHCKGLNGWQLEIADEGNIINFRILRPSESNAVLELIGRGLGEKAEWRGTRRRNGFTADAMIVRMRPVEDDDTISSLLYIVKLQASEACLSGIIDIKVNKNANALAQAAADNLPDICSPNPRVIGQSSAATAIFGG
jgi:hypothetical protein